VLELYTMMMITIMMMMMTTIFCQIGQRAWSDHLSSKRTFWAIVTSNWWFKNGSHCTVASLSE